MNRIVPFQGLLSFTLKWWLIDWMELLPHKFFSLSLHFRFLLKNDGLFLGSSSAMNCVGAVRVARSIGPGHTIVTILCDSGMRHLSKFHNSEYLSQHGLTPKATGLEFLGIKWTHSLGGLEFKCCHSYPKRLLGMDIFCIRWVWLPKPDISSLQDQSIIFRGLAWKGSEQVVWSLWQTQHSLTLGSYNSFFCWD